jgi:hypothetical protein
MLPPKRVKHGGKTDEHIIPKWLLDHLGIREAMIRPGQMDVKSRVILNSRHHTLNRFIAGSVCSICNGGWLSNLENQAMALLKSLIDDPRRISTMTVTERHIVARWTFKTAAIFNRASSFGNPASGLSRPVPLEHLQMLRSGVIPADVAVVGGGCSCEKPFDFFQGDNWSGPAHSVLLRPECQPQSYKIGLSFRDLL